MRVSTRLWICCLALFSSACAPGDDADASDSALNAAAANSSVWQAQVIYLALPDRFSNGDPSNDSLGNPGCTNASDPNLFHGGDLKGLTGKVSYLSGLGATALWITPLAKQVPLRNGACGYHGYWADYRSPDDGAIEPKLGTLADAKALRTALHAAGMKLIIDLVVNHTGRNGTLTATNPTWFHDPATCAALGASDIYCPLNGLPDFAQEDPIVAGYLTTLSKNWVSRLQPDGIRMDTAVNVLPAYFESSFVPGVRAEKGDLFLLAEVFDGGPFTGHILPVLKTGFDSTFNYPLHFALAAAFAQGGSMDLVAANIDSAIATLGIAQTRMLTTMLDNHDVPRFMTNAAAGTAPTELGSRYALAMTALFTLPGIPQIYQGDELGAFDADNRRDMPAGAFSAAGRAALGTGYLPNPAAIYQRTQKLIALRRANDALSAGDYTESWRPNGASTNALIFTRQTADETVIVAINAGASATGPLSIRSKAADGTTFTDLLGEGAAATISASGGRISIALPAKTAAIYRARN